MYSYSEQAVVEPLAQSGGIPMLAPTAKAIKKAKKAVQIVALDAAVFLCMTEFGSILQFRE